MTSVEGEDDDFLDFTPLPAVASPCTNICRIQADGFCAGCGRTLDEIASWSLATDEQRQAILTRIEAAQN